jgi:GNAT superfamily N-acetyltransferase
VIETGGEIQGVFGVTKRGYVAMQCPNVPPETWRDLVARLDGRSFWSVKGEVPQVRSFMKAFKLAPDMIDNVQDEPLLRLSLGNMAPAGYETRRPTEQDIPMLTDWWRDLFVDSGFLSEDHPDLEGFASAQAEQENLYPKMRLLLVDGTPSAMAMVNDRVLDTAKVDSVYTPAPLRGRGYGGAIVSAFLGELQSEGVNTGTLFAANKNATRAYSKIGFEIIGAARVIMAKSTFEVGRENFA